MRNTKKTDASIRATSATNRPSARGLRWHKIELPRNVWPVAQNSTSLKLENCSMRNTCVLLAFLVTSVAAFPLRAQSPEEIGATIGSFLRASFILQEATTECSEFGLQTHESNADLRDIAATRWGAAFTNDVLSGIRKEASRGVQSIKAATEGKGREFYCGFFIGTASQGHLLRRNEWNRLKAAVSRRN